MSVDSLLKYFSITFTTFRQKLIFTVVDGETEKGYEQMAWWDSRRLPQLGWWLLVASVTTLEVARRRKWDSNYLGEMGSSCSCKMPGSSSSFG